MTDETTRKITLFSLLLRTTHLMVGELVERLIANAYPDTSDATHPVFENIDRDGTRLTELAARPVMIHQPMCELVATLEQRGYLDRRPDPADGRAPSASPSGQPGSPRRAPRDGRHQGQLNNGVESSRPAR